MKIDLFCMHYFVVMVSRRRSIFNVYTPHVISVMEFDFDTVYTRENHLIGKSVSDLHQFIYSVYGVHRFIRSSTSSFIQTVDSPCNDLQMYIRPSIANSIGDFILSDLIDHIN